LSDSAAIVLVPGDSWQAAYLAAAPGSTILVKAGDHPVQELKRDPIKDGALERVVFQGEAGARLAGFSTGRSGGSGNTRGADHFELRDLEVGGQLKLTLADDVVLENINGGSFAISSSTNVTVRGGEFGPWVDGVNHINRCGSNPICPPSKNITLEGVVLHDFLISNPEPHSECLMIWGTETDGVTIRNTIFRNCTDFGLLVKAPGAKNIVIEDSFFDVPMPGNTATSECNPDCPRGGNSIRFSGVDNPYPGSRITNNVVNGGIAIDSNAVPNEGNAPGVIPESPTPAPALVAPMPAVSAFTESTVTLSWEPVAGARGYRFYRDGVLVSSTNDPARASVKFGVDWGSHQLGVEAFNDRESARGDISVESSWSVAPAS